MQYHLIELKSPTNGVISDPDPILNPTRPFISLGIVVFLIKVREK